MFGLYKCRPNTAGYVEHDRRILILQTRKIIYICKENKYIHRELRCVSIIIIICSQVSK